MKKKVLDIVSKGETLDCLVIECASETEAFQVESDLTHKIGLLIEKEGPLRNLRHGGLGGFTLSEDTKALLSKINTGKGNSNYGTKWSKERHAKFLSTYKQSIESGKVQFTPERMKNTWAHIWRNYKITFPDNSMIIVDNLTKWCNETGYPLTTLRTALKGDGFILSNYAKGQRGSGCKPSKLDGAKIEFHSFPSAISIGRSL